MKTRRQRGFADWLRATRPWSLTVSVLPALAAFAWLRTRSGAFDGWNAALSLGVLACAHAGANVLSDCRDAETGVDGDGTTNGVTWIADGLFRTGELRALGRTLLAFATLFGLVAALRSSLWLLGFGAIGLLLAFGYSALKRRALGDVAVLLAFTLVPAAGLGLACSGRIEPLCPLVLLPNGLLTLAVLHVNNVRDRVTDRAADCRTLATHLSPRAASVLFAFELFAPYLLVAVLLALRIVPYAAIAAFLTLPAVCRECALFRAGDLMRRDQGVARVQGAFGALYALALTVGALGFWTQLTLGALLLIAVSWRGHPPLPKHPRAMLRELLLGMALAAALWGVFWLGDFLSQRLFGFARDQVASVYALRAGASPLVLGGLLLLVIGPAEELFWRGTLQRKLSDRLGANAGCALATSAYALVHVFSGNFMLTCAAGVCGLFWGLAYRFFPRRFPAILASHAIWDVAVFLLFPIGGAG